MKVNNKLLSRDLRTVRKVFRPSRIKKAKNVIKKFGVKKPVVKKAETPQKDIKAERKKVLAAALIQSGTFVQNKGRKFKSKIDTTNDNLSKEKKEEKKVDKPKVDKVKKDDKPLKKTTRYEKNLQSGLYSRTVTLVEPYYEYIVKDAFYHKVAPTANVQVDIPPFEHDDCKNILRRLIKTCDDIDNPKELILRFKSDDDAEDSINTLQGMLFNGLPLKAKLHKEANHPLKRILKLPKSSAEIKQAVKNFFYATEITKCGGYSKTHTVTFKNELDAAVASSRRFDLDGQLYSLERYIVRDQEVSRSAKRKRAAEIDQRPQKKVQFEEPKDEDVEFKEESSGDEESEGESEEEKESDEESEEDQSDEESETEFYDAEEGSDDESN